MTNSINIKNSGEVIYLTPGIYSIKVIGGWDVNLGNFDLQLTKVDNGQKISPKRSFWRIQSYVRKKRAKKIFSISIGQSGKYEVAFLNISELRVRPSNLFVTRFFEKPIPTDKLEICIGC